MFVKMSNNVTLKVMSHLERCWDGWRMLEDDGLKKSKSEKKKVFNGEEISMKKNKINE